MSGRRTSKRNRGIIASRFVWAVRRPPPSPMPVSICYRELTLFLHGLFGYTVYLDEEGQVKFSLKGNVQMMGAKEVRSVCMPRRCSAPPVVSYVVGRSTRSSRSNSPTWRSRCRYLRTRSCPPRRRGKPQTKSSWTASECVPACSRACLLEGVSARTGNGNDPALLSACCLHCRTWRLL